MLLPALKETKPQRKSEKLFGTTRIVSSWDWFTSFLKSVPNHRIDDESLKEYFYRGQNDNNKVVLDTIVGGSNGECPYVEITKKLEKISWNNKAWTTRN